MWSVLFDLNNNPAGRRPALCFEVFKLLRSMLCGISVDTASDTESTAIPASDGFSSDEEDGPNTFVSMPRVDSRESSSISMPRVDSRESSSTR